MARVIYMTIYGEKEVSYKEKLNFMTKIIGPYNKFGLIHGFNNAYGYKKVCDQCEKSGIGAYYEAEIKSPSTYKTPETLLICNTSFLNKEKELMSFIVDDTRFEHPIEKYTYDTLTLMIKFQNFLYMKFKNIKIEISLKEKKDNKNIPLREFALGYFMSVLCQGYYVNTEFSSNRLLKIKEILYIMNIINQLFDEVKFELSQYYCDTCASHDIEHPYHIELDFVKKECYYE